MVRGKTILSCFFLFQHFAIYSFKSNFYHLLFLISRTFQTKKYNLIDLQDLVVDSLWSGVVHQRPLVKVAAANLFYSIIGFCNEELLKSKVIGAIVTLASDSDW